MLEELVVVVVLDELILEELDELSKLDKILLELLELHDPNTKIKDNNKNENIFFII